MRWRWEGLAPIQGDISAPVAFVGAPSQLLPRGSSQPIFYFYFIYFFPDQPQLMDGRTSIQPGHGSRSDAGASASGNPRNDVSRNRNLPFCATPRCDGRLKKFNPMTELPRKTHDRAHSPSPFLSRPLLLCTRHSGTCSVLGCGRRRPDEQEPTPAHSSLEEPRDPRLETRGWGSGEPNNPLVSSELSGSHRARAGAPESTDNCTVVAWPASRHGKPRLEFRLLRRWRSVPRQILTPHTRSTGRTRR